MTIETICPACEVGNLAPSMYSDDFKHGDATIHVDGLELCVCDNCGNEFIFPEQAKRNHLRVADAKRSKEGLLSGAEVRAIREQLDLTQQQAARLFGGGVNAFSKYERGENIQNRSTDVLLRMISEVSEAYSWLQAYSVELPPRDRDLLFIAHDSGDANWFTQELELFSTAAAHPSRLPLPVNDEFDSSEWRCVAAGGGG